MYHNPVDITPFRPLVASVFSVHTWGTLEIVGAILVIVLSFAQKSQDGSHSTGGVIGVISYISLVWKASFAFMIIWDGVFVLSHLEDGPRPIATLLILTLASQQARHLLYRSATRAVVHGRPWANAMFDTPAWLIVVKRQSRH